MHPIITKLCPWLFMFGLAACSTMAHAECRVDGDNVTYCSIDTFRVITRLSSDPTESQRNTETAQQIVLYTNPNTISGSPLAIVDFYPIRMNRIPAPSMQSNGVYRLRLSRNAYTSLLRQLRHAPDPTLVVAPGEDDDGFGGIRIRSGLETTRPDLDDASGS